MGPSLPGPRLMQKRRRRNEANGLTYLRSAAEFFKILIGIRGMTSRVNFGPRPENHGLVRFWYGFESFDYDELLRCINRGLPEALGVSSRNLAQDKKSQPKSKCNPKKSAQEEFGDDSDEPQANGEPSVRLADVVSEPHRVSKTRLPE